MAVRKLAAFAALVLWLVGTARGAWETPPEAAGREPVSTPEAIDEERMDESEHARRLNRARREHEARRAETAERLEVERAREKEAAGLQGAISNATRRESYLHHERYWAQREYDTLPRDPADLSAMARRGALDRELTDMRIELGTLGTVRQNAQSRFDALRLR